MIVVHIESGLGNQMLSYCEYLALKKANPNEKVYIETIIYEIPEADKYINQWNGYELKNIFNIDAPNIKELFSESEWKEIISEIKKTEFWKKNWNYPKYFTEVLNRHGFDLENIRGDFEKENIKIMTKNTKLTLKQRIKKIKILSFIIRFYKSFKKNKIINDTNNLYYKTTNSIFTGQRLTFKLRGNEIERIDKEIRKQFIFPRLDKKNQEIKKIIESNNSVAIHVRRGDMLYATEHNYKNGYFKRATQIVRRKVDNPLFIFFCDPSSADWCKENLKVFGLSKKDKVMFIDWNSGTDSYKDMQLMTYCKHNIITISTFGWWGAYLNNNTDKITISPEYVINTKYHC